MKRQAFKAHPASLVESVDIGSGTRIWAFAHVLPGARVGRDCNIGDHAYIEGDAILGHRVTLKNGVAVWSGVTLHDDVFVGPNAVFTNDLQPRSPRFSRVAKRYSDPAHWRVTTVVARGASIGANATIRCGTTIGAFAMIGAGAVVTRDVLPHALVTGVPARQVGWVCACGSRLKFDDGVAPCRACGSRWRDAGGSIREVRGRKAPMKSTS